MSLRLLIPACIIFSCTCMNGCTKNGSIGPKGDQGAAGMVGPAGASGTVIYSGTAAPDPSVGSPGDFYLDLTSDVLFGPKTASGWGAGFEMKGAAGATGPAGATGASGAAGTSGSQIYSGDGAPSTTVGVTGDYYLDKTGFTLYGPKLADGWGVPITLQGPEGTANVEYTPWFQFNEIVPDGSLYYGDQDVPALSQDLVDNGTVLVYSDMKGYSALIWPENYSTLLPNTVVYTPTIDYWSTEFVAGRIRVQVYTSDGAFNSAELYLSHIRIVLIPGGVSIPDGIGFDDLLRYMRTKAVN